VHGTGLLTRIRRLSRRISTSLGWYPETSQLDDVDRALLHALMVAPRASFRQFAAVLDVSDQTIARRYRRLAVTNGLRVFGLIKRAARRLGGLAGPPAGRPWQRSAYRGYARPAS
jgi:hypothetical protein